MDGMDKKCDRSGITAITFTFRYTHYPVENLVEHMMLSVHDG